MRSKVFISACLCWIILWVHIPSSYAIDVLSHFYTPSVSTENAPWFTGPLLAPSAHTVPQGHVNTEPYLVFTTFTGTYGSNWKSNSSANFYSLYLWVPTWVGITSFLDCNITPSIFYQFTEGERSTQLGDTVFRTGIQLVNEKAGTWWPAVKLSLSLNFPTGKFKNLDPNKLGTDGTGSGSWQPSITLSLGRLFEVKPEHYVSPRLIFSYGFPLTVPISNQTVYGGVEGTKGKIYPGNIFWTDIGLEYNLSRNWALALDMYYQHGNKSRFFGDAGILTSGLPCIMNAPASEQFSVAPAIEYNWSSNIGVIGGVWMSVIGKNSSQFISGLLAVNFYI